MTMREFLLGLAALAALAALLGVVAGFLEAGGANDQ